MKTRIFNLIILDASGSMSCIAEQAINGVNETVQTIRAAQKRHEDQEHFISLVLFNSDNIKTIYDKIAVEEVEDLNSSQYTPDCGTPLYDAMGHALTQLRKYVTDTDNVLVTTVTDGYENSSTEYREENIKQLVDELKAQGWVFTYIGANQDATKVASTISITNVLHFQTTREGTQSMFTKENHSRSLWFDRIACENEAPADNFFNENN